MSEHGHAEHGKKEFGNPNYNIPKSLPVLIILILAAMWFYLPTVKF